MSLPPYSRSAAYYDLIYGGRDHQKECDLLEVLLQRHAGRVVKRILDLGSGTGSHALELSSRGYSVLGIDTSEEFVAIAREKAGASEDSPSFQVGDMQDLNVRGKFDVIVSMFGAFGYVPRETVRATLEGIKGRLREGGLLMFEFWNMAGVEDGRMSWEVREGPSFRLLRLGRAELDPDACVLNVHMRHFVLRGKTLADDFEEVHRLSLYSQEEMEGFLRGVRLQPLAMLDWDQKVLEPAPPHNFRIFAVARRDGP